MRQRKYYLTILLSALTLTLAVRFAHKHQDASVGFSVKAAHDTCDCLIYRVVVLRLRNSGEIVINDETARLENLSELMSKIYSTRAEKDLFLEVDDDVPFQRVAEVIDRIKAARYASFETDLGITVLLVTPGSRLASCPRGCYNWAREGIIVMHHTVAH